MATVEKITIALTSEMAGFVRSAVDAGEYASTSEAIRDAVRQWKERRDLLGYTVEDLRVLVQEGIESGPSSRTTMAEVKASARERFRIFTTRTLTVLPVIRTNRADEDLMEIWSYIAVDNISAADRVLDAIEARWDNLARHPYSGVARDDIAPGIRHLVSGEYLTLYRLRGGAIEIVRVLHGRRKISSKDTT
ncbi:type II toxin-antitoxin system ParD family antitoxin [Rhizobium beringeri]